MWMCVLLLFHAERLFFTSAIGVNRSCSCTSSLCNFTNVCDPPETCIKENVALGKLTNISSSYQTPIASATCLAVDGNRQSIYTPGDVNTSANCIHTNNRTDEWWFVDLGRNYTVSEITVYRRLEEANRLANIEITVDEVLCYKFPSNTIHTQVKTTVHCFTSLVGRIVKFSTHNEYINICEVEVWVCKTEEDGATCHDSLCASYVGNCASEQACTCDSGCNTSGPCSTALHCRTENVALGKKTTMSSTYEAAGSGCLAVNGNTSTEYLSPSISERPNCIHTLDGPTEWWEVDLGRNYTIQNITVYRRNDIIDRMANIRISVGQDLCYTFPSVVDDLPEKIQVACSVPLTGHIVRLTTHNKYLNFCEVQVWVCKFGWFGEDCDHVCHCQDITLCDNYYGTCPSGCDDGYYGTNCSLICGNCLDMTECETSTGHCLSGCKSGWKGSLCNEIFGEKDEKGAIIGGVFGACLLVGGMIFVTILIWRRKKKGIAERNIRGSVHCASLETSSHIAVYENSAVDSENNPENVYDKVDCNPEAPRPYSSLIYTNQISTSDDVTMQSSTVDSNCDNIGPLYQNT